MILTVWESLDYICAERLTPSLLSTAKHLARFGVVQLTASMEQQLTMISRATVARLLSKHRSRKTRLPRKGPERANQATKGVPMKRIPWNTSEPGHFEVDLVPHCGETTAGEYGQTLQMVDVATGCSERVVVLGRGQRAMEAAFRQILARLPFEVKELHPDNGSEFFNHHLVRYWKEKVVGITLSRSRPYQKNDNRIVEQKNDALVRQYLGYGRVDAPQHIQAVDDLYERMWLSYNLFQPVLHLAAKETRGDQVRRKWDRSQTPFERLKATGSLSPAQQERLQTLYEQTNPLALREEIYARLAAIWDLQTKQTSSVA